MNPAIEAAQRMATGIKRSSKHNRRFKVHGILVSKGKGFVQVTSKKTGKPHNLQARVRVDEEDSP